MDTNTITVVGVLGALALFDRILNYFNKGYNMKRQYEQLDETSKRHAKELNQHKVVQEALVLGMKALLKNELKKLHKEYIAKGHVTSDELDNFNTIFMAYDSMNGNGTGTKYYNEVCSLPIMN